MRGRGALAAGGARARARPREGRARRQGAAQEAEAARGPAPARLALLALHGRERHQLGAGGDPRRGGQAEAARGGLGHGRCRAGALGPGCGPRRGRARGAQRLMAATGADGAARAGRRRRGLGAGPGPRRGRGRALGAWGPPEPALTARFPGDWGGSFRLQLSYYALHAARLSTCHRRRSHVTLPRPSPPPSAPARPAAAFPNREGANERGSAREGTDARRRRRGWALCAGRRVGAQRGPRGGCPRGPEGWPCASGGHSCEGRPVWTRRPGWGWDAWCVVVESGAWSVK